MRGRISPGRVIFVGAKKRSGGGESAWRREKGESGRVFVREKKKFGCCRGFAGASLARLGVETRDGYLTYAQLS